MILNINFPDDLNTKMLLGQSKIPCFCMVGESFEIRFDSPLPEACGFVSEWDRHKLEERAPAGGGGKYTYYQPALISLKEIDGGKYQVIDLELFCESVGWCPIINQSEYAPPGSFWDDDIEY
jgi:hypothetical protein